MMICVLLSIGLDEDKWGEISSPFGSCNDNKAP